MLTRRRWLGASVAAAVLLLVLVAALGFEHWRRGPLAGLRADTVVIVPQGTSLNAVARLLEARGVLSASLPFVVLGRLEAASSRLKAGEYALRAGSSPQDVLELFVSGQVVAHRVTLLEGWTFQQAVAAVRAHEAVEKTAAGGDPVALAAALGRPDGGVEGRLFPDTYTFPRGTTDVELLRRAATALDDRLQRAWRERAEGLPLASPAEALVLASLVEKETAVDDERPLVAGVFVNRLRLGMRLQTDPAVIYGMGAAFDGNLRRQDLRRDTPYNTYTRAGLPPTPIALPGAASIVAATRPASTGALYFVASGQGDGRHRFASTLAEHNRNVASYLATLRSSGEDRP
ncbi:MAG: endolytic transglycosylase MltG [Steroidobacteraceae bacterium]